MKEDILFTVAFFGGLATLTLFIFVMIKITDFIDNIITKRREKKYPEFFALVKEINDRGNEICRKHNAVVPDLMKKIDRIDAELKYLPKEQFEIKSAELEELRQQLYTANAETNEREKALNEVREKAHNYVKVNDLKWAKRWGW